MVPLLAFAMLLIPLAIAPGWFFYFDVTPKVVVLLCITAAAAVAWGLTGVGAGLYRASKVSRYFLPALGAMAISVAISTAASVHPALSLGGSNWRYWGLV